MPSFRENSTSYLARTGLETAAFLAHDLGLSDEEIASSIEVHSGTVRRWLHDPNSNEPRLNNDASLRRIAAVADFAIHILGAEPPSRVGNFLRTPSITPSTLEMRTPLEDLKAGNTTSVLALAQIAFPKSQ